ncbi:MAG: phosphoribosyl-AMP cyclohydrolase [Butyricicoccus sp.]
MELSKFFKKAPLVPIICQDERNGEVLMLGYANEEALQLTMDTGTAWFFSRSRQKLWNKGETSGNFIFVSRILSDCDDDTLIYVGTPKGPVCHRTPHLLFHHAVGEAGRKVRRAVL